MAKWRKKPVVVDAEIYRFGLEDGFQNEEYGSSLSHKWEERYKKTSFPSGVALARRMDRPTPVPYIETLEGRHNISPGDYIITGVNGERYPCKPDIFKKTYERVEDN